MADILDEFAAAVAARNASAAEKDSTIGARDSEILRLITSGLQKDETIAGLREAGSAAVDTIDELRAEVARLTALLKPPFILGDATRKQFLGAPFTEPFPGSYEDGFWPSTVTDAQELTTPIQRAFVSGTTMPKWRALYPNAQYWFGDLELFHSNGLTAIEVGKLLPAYQGARDFAVNEGKGLKLGAYGIPLRFGNHMTDAEVMAQMAICKPILDLLDYCLLTLYPIYTDLAKSRTYIRRNIAHGRRAMPGKKVIVLGWDKWHNNVGAPLAGTPVSAEWQRMFLEEISNPDTGADGYAPWLTAATPKPTNEPWWLETRARLA